MQAAEDSLREGRERVLSLRGDGSGGDLAAALTAVYNEEANPAGMRLRMAVKGEPPELRHTTAEEIFLIGREAIRNALAHSDATDIEVELNFGGRFRLHVRDNGRGMTEGAAREGHWGLQGMHERAARIGGTLRVLSRPTRGADVALSVPGGRLYTQVPSGRWVRRFTLRRSGPA